ncbi:MAG: CRISPR-associated protein Cas4 [Treponema sp.]|jgi:CRISPR-associated exonuclease Cas4|nr:CRISPR-associated protein Cas4 [Treponema sp.]
MFDEENLIPISALQHVLFCERQYALIHLEQLWEENFFTAEGRVLHERVDTEHHESRKNFRQEYGMALRSLSLGLIGKCDLVELWYSEDDVVKRISPVEFKRGKEKADDVDRVQLCAQAICLEEMFSIPVEGGQIYYLQEHRRTNEAFNEELRSHTRAAIERARALWESGKTPAAEYEKNKCDRCSIVDICMPKNTGKGSKNVERFIQNQLRIIRAACMTDREQVNEVSE